MRIFKHQRVVECYVVRKDCVRDNSEFKRGIERLMDGAAVTQAAYNVAAMNRGAIDRVFDKKEGSYAL